MDCFNFCFVNFFKIITTVGDQFISLWIGVRDLILDCWFNVVLDSRRMVTQSGNSSQNVDDYFKQDEIMITQSVRSFISTKSSNFDSVEARFFRDVCVCVFHIHKNHDSSHVFVSIMDFLGKYYSFDKVQEIVKTILSYESVETQSFVYARKVLDNWKSLGESDLARQTQRVIFGVISSGVLATMGMKFSSEGLSSYLNTRPSSVRFNSINDMAFSVCELVLSFAEVGYECFTERSLQPVLCRDRHCRNWMKECEELVKQLETSPTNINFDPAMCLSRIDNLLARGVTLMKDRNQILAIYWKDLSQRRSSLVATHNISNMRKSPFSLLIHGRPGIGKTSIMNILANHFHKIMVSRGIDPDLEWDPKRHMYTRNPDDEFFSGYQGAVHWCMVLDDLARESPTQVKNGQATSIKDVITIVNTVGVCTNQAELSKKGTVPLLPKLVLASTNTKDLNARLAVAEPAAVLRRFPYVITPYLKPEFEDKDTKTMRKLTTMEQDAWVFDLELFCQTEHSSEYKMLEEKCSMGVLQKFLSEKIEEHFKSATMMLESMRPDDEELCEHGVMIKYCDPCKKHDEIVEFDAMETQVFSWFRPKQLSFRERLMANFVFYTGRYTPYWMYAKVINHIGLYDKTVRAGVDDIFRISVPPAVAAMQYAFGCLLSFSFILFIVSYMRGGTMECQSEELLRDEKESKNFWAALRKQNEDFVVPRTSRKGNLQELKSSLSSSMVRLIVNQDGVNCEVSALFLKKGWFVTVGHIFPNGNEPVRCLINFGKRHGKSHPIYPFTLDRSRIVKLPNDLALFQTNAIIPRKPMWEFLAPVCDEVGRDGVSINYVEGQLDEGHVETIGMTYSSNQHTDGTYVKGLFMQGWRYDRKPTRGDCGSVLLSSANGKYFISGLHCAGTSNSLYPTRGYKLLCTPISKSLLQSYIEEDTILTMSGYAKPIKVEAGSRSSGKLKEPHYKGIHHWATTSSTMLGSYPGRTRSTSRVKETFMKEEIGKSFPKLNLEYGAPLMTPILNNEGQWLNPFTIAASAQGNIPGFFNEVDVEFVARSFLADLVKDTKWLKDVGPVDDNIAINGISGDPWINRLPMSTSGGFYFPGAKKQYFEQLDEETYIPNENVKNMIRYIENQYKMGRRANVLFNGTLKDEPTKLKKIAAGKTRVFTASDVAFSIVVRKQYLKITKAFMTNNFVTECAVGMNCYSEQWQDLYEYLTVFGKDRIIAGDYSNYDKRMPAIFIRAAFWILDECRSKLRSVSQTNYQIGRGIATDISFPITNMNGDVFQFAGGNSSGHPLTVIINSIVNSLYMRFAYFKLNLPLQQFRLKVRLMTLGDDNIMGSSDDNFNHTAIQKILEEHGVPYTMADKESKSRAFINISEADFLKRSFRKNEIRIVGPLDLRSIFKSLCFYVEKDNISKYEHFAQCYLSARREWSLHGEEVFNNCVDKISAIIARIPEGRRIRDFTIPAHYWDYKTTLEWVLNCTEEMDEQAYRKMLSDNT